MKQYCMCSSCGPWPMYGGGKHHPNCPSSDAAGAERERNAEAIERARVVGVLDAYDDAHATSHHRPTVVVRAFGGYATAIVKDVFPTRDAARAAAAKAIENGEVQS